MFRAQNLKTHPRSPFAEENRLALLFLNHLSENFLKLQEKSKNLTVEVIRVAIIRPKKNYK